MRPIIRIALLGFAPLAALTACAAPRPVPTPPAASARLTLEELGRYEAYLDAFRSRLEALARALAMSPPRSQAALDQARGDTATAIAHDDAAAQATAMLSRATLGRIEGLAQPFVATRNALRAEEERFARCMGHLEDSEACGERQVAALRQQVRSFEAAAGPELSARLAQLGPALEAVRASRQALEAMLERPAPRPIVLQEQVDGHQQLLELAAFLSEAYRRCPQVTVSVNESRDLVSLELKADCSHDAAPARGTVEFRVRDAPARDAVLWEIDAVGLVIDGVMLDGPLLRGAQSSGVLVGRQLSFDGGEVRPRPPGVAREPGASRELTVAEEPRGSQGGFVAGPARQRDFVPNPIGDAAKAAGSLLLAVPQLFMMGLQHLPLVIRREAYRSQPESVALQFLFDYSEVRSGGGSAAPSGG